MKLLEKAKRVWMAVFGVLWIASAVQAQTPEPFRAVVTVSPLKGLVEPVLPTGATLTVLMQPGKSEHGYEFSPSDLAKLANADLVVYVGLNLEPKLAAWLAEHPSPTRRVVEFASAVKIEAEPNEGHDHEGHVHGEACEHNHGGPDQHLWLDPVLVKELVPQVRAAVQHSLADRNAPDEVRNGVNERAASLIAKVEETDRAWTEAFKAAPGLSIVTHHNAFSRPAERYGFTVAEAILASEGAQPTPADISRVVSTIKAKKVKALFVEPQFDPKLANRIARAAKIKVATLDPLGDGDWFAMMAANLKSIVENAR